MEARTDGQVPAVQGRFRMLSSSALASKGFCCFGVKVTRACGAGVTVLGLQMFAGFGAPGSWVRFYNAPRCVGDLTGPTILTETNP